MARRYSKAIHILMLFTAIAAAPKAIADDCGPGSSNPTNPTCLPGTYVYSQIQQQQQQQQQQAADAAAAQAQRDADFKRMTEQNQAAAEQSAAAADPRNQYDPNSPYYGAKQCAAAKQSLFCALGFACTPPNVDCAQFASRPVAREHHHHHHHHHHY